ncbi:MAG: ribonuclease D, partial [Sedimenticolaceae bacterium]
MQELHVETAEQLTRLCELISGSQWLALDTEFVREKSYYPNFCLLQVSNGEVAASVDPLSLD